MKKILFIIICIFSGPVFCQKTSIQFFKDYGCTKEVKEENATYRKIVVSNPDSSISNTLINIRKNYLEYTESFKGPEPTGVWKSRKVDGSYETLNYDFNLLYGISPDCNQSSDDSLSQNDSLFAIPKIKSSGEDLTYYISHHLKYPKFAVENGLSGKVYLQFRINESGEVFALHILRGTDPILDKEAARMIREIIFDHGTSDICYNLPISFLLR